MRYCAQDVFPPVFDGKLLQQIFKARLVLDIQDVLEFSNLVLRKVHPIDDSAEEIHAAQIDLKSLDTKPLERFDRDEQNFDICRFSSAAIMLDADLGEFPLPSTLGFFESQDLARVEQADWLRRRRQTCGYCFCQQGSEFRSKSQNISFAIDEPVNVFFLACAHTLRKHVVIIENRRDDFLIRPAFEDRTDCPFQNPPPARCASDKYLCPRRNLGVGLHLQTLSYNPSFGIDIHDVRQSFNTMLLKNSCDIPSDDIRFR